MTGHDSSHDTRDRSPPCPHCCTLGGRYWCRRPRRHCCNPTGRVSFRLDRTHLLDDPLCACRCTPRGHLVRGAAQTVHSVRAHTVAGSVRTLSLTPVMARPPGVAAGVRTAVFIFFSAGRHYLIGNGLISGRKLGVGPSAGVYQPARTAAAAAAYQSRAAAVGRAGASSACPPAPRALRCSVRAPAGLRRFRWI